MRMPDPQQKRAYAWEDDWDVLTIGKKLPLADVRGWVKWACEKYKVPVPVVRGHRQYRGGTSYYDPDTHSIEFRKRHWNVWVALHEAAHAITDHILGHDLPAHGKTWLGVYMWLLRESGIPAAALEATAKERGLTWDPPDKVSPKFIRSTYRKLAKQAAASRK